MKKFWIVIVTFFATTLFWAIVLFVYMCSLVIEGNAKYIEKMGENAGEDTELMETFDDTDDVLVETE